jgi:serine protease AprX
MLCSAFMTQAQQKVWVFFQDKEVDEFDPFLFFDEKAIERREREGFPLNHVGDIPVNLSYLNQIEELCDSVGYASRWFNAVSCFVTDAQRSEISALSFVKDIKEVGVYEVEAAAIERDWGYDPERVLKSQAEILGASVLRSRGLNGKGVRIAIFDAGFEKFDKAGPLQHLKDSNRVIATYDFVKNKKFVFDHNVHGTEVLTCVAGFQDDRYFGCATGAEFLLARTERSRAGTSTDEDHWIASLEWADKWGADIVNSSLGYTVQLYFRHQMDGQHSMISKAASMAIQRGILVVNSAGNEGESRWELMSAPADGDSVLSVGAIDPWTGYHSDFSSYGPTFDFRMKPNVVAFGYAAVEFDGITSLASGTSFAAPLITGFAACLRQMHPEWTCGKLLTEIQNAGHLYPYFDYAHGFGVPHAGRFMEDFVEPLNCPECFELTLTKSRYPEDGPFSIQFEVDTLCLGYKVSSLYSKWKDEKEYFDYAPLCYFQLAEPDGFVSEYFVAQAMNKGVLCNIFMLKDDQRVFRIWFNGHNWDIPISEIKEKEK